MEVWECACVWMDVGYKSTYVFGDMCVLTAVCPTLLQNLRSSLYLTFTISPWSEDIYCPISQVANPRLRGEAIC